MIDRRMFLGGALGLGALAALPACGRISREDPGSAEIASARPLSVCLTTPRCLDPYNAYDDSSLTVVWQLFDALTSYDFETGELSCLAAERYEMADDARAFTFRLRDASFHNGDPVTAYDFKRAWERIVSPASAAAQAGGPSTLASMLSIIQGYSELHAGEAQELSGVTCPDSSTIHIALRTPYADLPYVLAHPALGPVPACAEEDAETFARQPIGNGPFVMNDPWDGKASTLELSRFDDYALTPATIAAVRFEIAADTEQGFQFYQTGDVDVCRCPVREASGASSSFGRPQDGRMLARDNRFVCRPGLAVSMLAYNCDRAPFSSVSVRRALSLAIDRDFLANTLYRKTRIAADGVVMPTVKGYREAAWPYAMFDRDEARALLDDAIPLDEGGERSLSIKLLFNADGGHEEVMEAIAENLEDVGISCELEKVDLDTLRERVAARDFDLVRVDWTTDAPTLDGVLFPLFFSASDTSTNVSGYRSDAVDEELARARAESSTATRVAILQGVDDVVGRDCPVIPLMFQATAYVGSERIEALAVDPQGRLSLATARLGE